MKTQGKFFRRTPKRYSGVEPSEKPISSYLPEILQKIEEDFERKPKRVLEAWPEIIGKKIAPMTKAISLENGILKVLVKSSTLYSLLSLYEKRRLLEKLQKRFSKKVVKILVFRKG